MEKQYYLKIAEYINNNPRNKIIIYQDNRWELEPHDIGWHLSEYFHNSKEGDSLSMVVSTRLSEIMNNACFHHPVFGNTLAITNIGILLEPALKLNFQGFLDNYSQNNALFLHWPGESDAQNLYFLSKDHGINIYIGNLSHIKA